MNMIHEWHLSGWTSKDIKARVEEVLESKKKNWYS
jgi:hypothetical protein